MDKLAKLRAGFEGVSNHVHAWAKEAATQILAERDRVWRELYSKTAEQLNAVTEKLQAVSARKISGLGKRDRTIVRADAENLLRHLQSGGRLGFGPFRPKIVKDGLYLINEVRVDGHLCSSVSALQSLLEWVEVVDRIESLQSLWSPHTDPPKGLLSAQFAEYCDLCEPLYAALELYEEAAELRAFVRAVHGFPEPRWHELQSLRALELATEAVSSEEQLSEAREAFHKIRASLDHHVADRNAHPVLRQLAAAIDSRDTQKYESAFHLACELKDWRGRLTRRDELESRLTRAAPQCATSLSATRTDSAWDARLPSFTASWNWARCEGWLEKLTDPHLQHRLTTDLDRHRSHVRDLLKELAAERAWGFCFQRMTERERQHLMAWTLAMRRIGKGTGKYAAMHRRAAREHMEQCRSAIPAWIMPTYRVAETVRPGVDMFDVVIVDEASQSGIESLFLQYLARKVVVVGDDKQIKPEYVGVTREDVELLRVRHIHDIPLSAEFGIDNSFFDQAQVRYGGRIRLREHFRCMPEVIQFSNNLCYASEPLVPLRQYGSGRLTPVVATRYVESGYQQGYSPRITNPPEAEAIVTTIVECCNNPAYRGKTMGVISLLGEHQAREIERLLLQGIGPEEMERRGLVCGDAYAFQGDERDVMFLSLVSAPTQDHRIGTLATAAHERRFNVAASRARDQMWLFHSVTLNDLNPRCLRYRLLEYCLNPKVEPVTLQGINLSALREVARSRDREQGNQPPPFDSWFEVDVFLKIIERNYRVIPQFEVAGYFIDFLVEGFTGRLAVECDGPYHDDLQQIERDMARQRQLERCGWTFWRVSASSFYSGHDKAMDSLWRKLDELEIRPVAATVTPADVQAPPPEAKPLKSPLLASRRATQSTQLDLVQPPQLELGALAGRVPATTVTSVPEPPVESFEAVVAKLKGSRQTDFFTRSDICKAILALLGPGTRIPQGELVARIVSALGMPEDHARRIQSALDALETEGKVTLGIDYVARR